MKSVDDSTVVRNNSNRAKINPFPDNVFNHYDRPRVQIDCSEPKLTDQSYAKACDINVIMANYTKTGVLPQVTQIPGRYVDNTEVPDLMEAFNIVKTATDAFYTLPPNIRKLMDNDPSKLESFIADPNNVDLLCKEGILVKREEIRAEQKETKTEA